MITVTNETADAAIELLSDYIPTLQSEYRDVIEKLMHQFEKRECNEADLTFALCLLQDLIDAKSENTLDMQHNSVATKSKDKVVNIERKLIDFFYALLMQQTMAETGGFALWEFKRQL